ncbi:hypothetical protein ACTXT7_007091 [Hymenolepis weldensis]
MIGGHVRADPTEVPTVMHMKFPATVIVFGIVIREGDIITPHFFPQGLKVSADADAYLETLQTIVVKPPWIDSVANGGRPPMSSSKICLHPIKLTKPRIGWMAENFHYHVTTNFLQPPNYSLNLNPLDYCVWAGAWLKRKLISIPITPNPPP